MKIVIIQKREQNNFLSLPCILFISRGSLDNEQENIFVHPISKFLHFNQNRTILILPYSVPTIFELLAVIFVGKLKAIYLKPKIQMVYWNAFYS